MNKKFLSAILFGALMVTSTGTFVSCKDYEDDIKDVQEQVDANKSALAALTSQATALQSALTAAQATAEAAKTAAAEAKKAGDDALAAAKAAEAAAADAKAEAIAEAQKQVEALQALVAKDYATKEELEAAKKELATSIAAVDGKIEGIETGLSELKNVVEGLEEQLGVLSLTALSNIAALQEDLELQKAALEKYQVLVDQLYVEIGGEAGLRTQLGQVTNVVTDMQKELEELWAEIGGEAGLGSTTGTLASAIQALQQGLEELAERDNALEGNIHDVTKTLSSLIEDHGKDVEELWAEINGEGANSIRTQMGQLAGLVGEIHGNLTTLHTMVGDMVTSVALWTSDHAADDTHSENGLFKECDHVLTFTKVNEQDNTFPAVANVTDRQYEFKEGNIVTYSDQLIIRVSPTTARPTKDQISLINSLGQDLTEFVTVEKVEEYNELLTFGRAALNNGLWKVTFKLKENYDPEAFAKAVSVEKNKETKAIRFAVAVNNTVAEEGQAPRRVISGYELGVEAVDGVIASPDFLVNGTSIWDIKNRYYYCDDWTDTRDVEELVWFDNNAPATKAILEGEDANAGDRVNRYDYRQDRPILPVEKGQPIKIQIDWNAELGTYNHQIKGFYVTLDKEFALESSPSEINAWNSYEYKNLNTLIDGNEGEIVIEDLNNVQGDIIGFRVYAVNLDGTLLDPDGRAFYVVVGEVAQAETIEVTLKATAAEAWTDYIATEAFIENDNVGAWEVNENNPVYEGQPVENTLFEVLYFDADKNELDVPNEDVKYIKVGTKNVANFIDGETYTQSIEMFGAYNALLKTVTVKMTKVLPTEFPTTFSAKDKQIINGLYTCYLQPTTQNWEVGETPAEVGYMDLGSVFNGLIDSKGTLLDDNYKFIFATSKQEGEGEDMKLVDNVVTFDNPESYYQLQVTPANEFIKAGEEKATKVVYIYQGVKTYKDKDGKWKIAENHEVEWATQFNTKYACWHTAQTWSVVKPANNAITYAATEKTVDLANIKGVNSYNNTLFGEGADKKQTLKDLVTKKYLKINDAFLTSDATDEEEYFDITVGEDGITLTFVPMKDEVQSNPQDAVASTLTIVCEDCFGCEVKIAVPYTVNKQ